MSKRAQPFEGTERFSIVRLVGTGGMGVVYEVFDRERRQTVALKTLRSIDATSLYRFKHEFRALAEIVHPNLIPLYELFADGDQWFFTMELIERATDFLSYLRQGHADSDSSSDTETRTQVNPSLTSPLMAMPALEDARESTTTWAGAPFVDTERLYATLPQLASGVHTLHEAGKLHRDLKPRNVLVREDGRVVVLDLGLVADLLLDRHDRPSSGSGSAPHSEPRTSQESDHGIAGTVAYMSPEQAAREPLTPASDWYAVGVMLFQALTGRLPFTGPAASVLQEKQHRDPPRPSNYAWNLPPDLVTLCERLMRRDPLARPSGAEILDTLGASPARMPVRIANQWVDDQPFVGRDSHLRALADGFGAMRAGQPLVLRVHGRSGAGKSTLLSRFLMDIAGQDDAVVLTGRCYEQESVPFKAVDSLVDALTRYLMSLSRDDLDLVTPPHTAELTRMFPVLARVLTFSAERRSRPGGDAREQRRLAAESLAYVLAAIGRQRPLVLYVDDVQWGDADSARLLRDVFASPGAPVALVLLAYRREYATTSPFLLTMAEPGDAGPQDRELAVEPLTREEALTLAHTLLGDGRADRDTEAAWVARESGGSALFVHELVEHLKSGAQAGPHAADLDAVLWERVQRLPDVTRRLMEVVAVAGRPVRLHDAQAAAHLPALPQDAIAQLRAARLVRTMRLDARHDEIEMFHDRIRESIIDRLLPEVRRHHHAGLAVALELAGDADPETLAVHLEGAGDAARAGTFYALAAEEAVRVLAFDRAEALFRRAAALVTDDAERARIHERMIHFFTDLAHFGDAYAVARDAVAPYGIHLPARFVPPLFAVDFLKARWRLRGRSTRDLLDLPLIGDRRVEAAVSLMDAVAKAAYQVRPELCVAVATRIVNLCLVHGNTRDCAVGYMVFGAIFQGGVLGNHRAGHDFGQLALSLVERYGNSSQRAEVNFVVGYFGTSWLQPATQAEALWKTAFESGLQTGDLFHTGCACAATIMSYHMRGLPIDEVWRETERFLPVLEGSRLQEPAGVVHAVRQVIRNLRGETLGPHTLSDGTFDEDAFVSSLDGFGSRHFAHCYFVVRMQTAYLRGEYQRAAALATRAAAYLGDSRGMLHGAEHHFYSALIEAAGAGRARRVRRVARRFARWAAACPHNFQHKARILDGEVARLRGRHAEALAAYEQARHAASQYGYPHIEALADQLAARVHASAGDEAERRAAIERATLAYRQWGVAGPWGAEG